MNPLQVTFTSSIAEGSNRKNETANCINVSLEGNLNSMNAINFKKDLIRLIAAENTDCTVNLKNLESIDLTGLNALAMAHKNLEQQGKKLTVVCSKENPVDQFLHLTKFNRYLNVKRA